MSEFATSKNLLAPAKIRIGFTVNGTEHQVETWPMARLLDVLREDLRLTGTKEGCGEGECGACSVFIDGVLVNACLVPVLQVSGCDVLTVEGLAQGRALTAAQTAFITHGGAQCGICTPGMLMATVNLLKQHPEPDDTQVREALGGNLCRCTGYTKIFDSVHEAARLALAQGGV